MLSRLTVAPFPEGLAGFTSTSLANPWIGSGTGKAGLPSTSTSKRQAASALSAPSATRIVVSCSITCATGASREAAFRAASFSACSAASTSAR